MKTETTRRGVDLTQIGLGAAQLGNLYRETTEEQARSAVDTAWEGGVRYFDTAPHYGLGLSERRLGALLRERPRDEYVVSSKVGRLLVASPETAHERDSEGFDVPAVTRREWDFSRDGVRRSLEATLERTGLDRIDVVYLHDVELHWEQGSTEGVAALQELRDEGVVGAIGAGMNDAARMAELIRRSDLDIVMLAGRYTLLEQGALDDVLPLALERDIGVVIAGVYNSGLLSTERPDADARYNYDRAPRHLVDRATAIAEVCERHGVTLPQAAIRFPLLHPAVVSVVVGGRDGAQVAGSLDRYESEIPDALWRDLRDAALLRADA
jgi:D-threo-aldose 1-dehydrogenase